MQGRISRCGDELARTALYEVAHSLLILSTKRSALRARGITSPNAGAWRTHVWRSPESWL